MALKGEGGRNKKQTYDGRQTVVGRVIVENVRIGAGAKGEVSNHGNGKIEKGYNTKRKTAHLRKARNGCVLELGVKAWAVVCINSIVEFSVQAEQQQGEQST